MTATATTSKKFAFTYDHVNKKIVGTDIAFQKAGIPGSALEAELNIRITAYPAYGFTVIPTEKKPAKQTYKGLTRDLMKEYIQKCGENYKMSQRKEDDKKRKKKQQAMIDAFVMQMLEKSMKSAMKTVMNDLFKDFK